MGKLVELNGWGKLEVPTIIFSHFPVNSVAGSPG